MRFRDLQITILKGMHPDPHHALRKMIPDEPTKLIGTARLLSPFPNGSNIGLPKPRPGLDQDDVMHVKPNRAALRSRGVPRRRLKGVALPTDQQPWKAS